jgi:NADPH:quinone reductase
MRRLTLLAALVLSSLALCTLSHAQTPAVPQTMRAAAFDHGGGPEVLSIHTLPVPTPGAGEVLIAVHAAGVAVWELDFRQHPNPRMRFPAVLGGDGSGTIVAIGPAVHGFKVGDHVYGTADGFYAEYVKARADRIAHIPKGISLTEAGVLAISGLSALQGIDDVLQLKRGETLIIHGASGAVGGLAIQLAKLRGAKVLATATSDEGLALATKLGADSVVNGKAVRSSGRGCRVGARGWRRIRALYRCLTNRWSRPGCISLRPGTAPTTARYPTDDAVQLHSGQPRARSPQQGRRAGTPAGSGGRGVPSRRCC